MGDQEMASTGQNRMPVVVFSLALLTTLPILWRTVLPMADGRNWPRHASHLANVLIHAGGGLSMLIFGAASLYVGWTRRHFRWHRWLGYSYLGLGSIGALAALNLSVYPKHEPFSTGIATGTLAVFWLAFAAMAWRAAHNRRFDSHREWMIRSYVLTWTFVGCRLATIVDFSPWLGAESITAAIWVNWVVPVLICEIALQWRRGSAASRS
jgi:hypothetical protein